jgi:hypothetical protein
MDDHHPKRKPQKIVALLAIFLIILAFASTTSAQGTYYFEIGANGDDGSKGNVGVRVEIRTHSYFGHVYVAANGENRTTDSFVIGEPFSDGSVIYFGYYLYDEHAQWSWQRLSSSGLVEEEGVGVVDSVEPNSTWHSYSIVYDSLTTFAQRTWDFILDSSQVGLTQQTIDESKASTGSVLVFGEKITNNILNNIVLGPVEFRNLAYLNSGGWHDIASLRARVNCLNKPNTKCDVEFPYGVSELGANHIIVGMGMPNHTDGDLLWTTTPTDYLKPYLTPIGVIALIILVAYFAIRRVPIINPNWKPKIGEFGKT